MSWAHVGVLFGSIFSTISALFYAHGRWHRKQFYNEVEYLSDSPFPFHPESDSGDDYIVFDLVEGTTLWCEYSLGIRSDGVYGVSHLKVKGLNGYHHKIKLKIGQSIFPIIEGINKFEDWTKEKTFDTQWDSEFTASWNDMKKKLDNLRILEEKSKQKEAKEKKPK
jgi:hypothetical protein